MRKSIEELQTVRRYYLESKFVNVETEKLDDMCEIQNGKRVKKKDVQVSDDLEGDMYPCYGGGDISFYMGDYNREGRNVLISRFGMSPNCVRLVDRKLWLNDSGFTIEPSSDKLDRIYLMHLMKFFEPHIYRLGAGACQKNLDSRAFKNLQIPVPDLKEQKEIVEYCERISTMIRMMEVQIEENEVLMKDVIQGYLKRFSTQSNDSESDSELDEVPKKVVKRPNRKASTNPVSVTKNRSKPQRKSVARKAVARRAVGQKTVPRKVVPRKRN